MCELVQVGEKTYYINYPTKIGIYVIKDNEVCIIDSGNNKSSGKRVLKILKENNWTLKMIINTHSHADHIGGNKFLQDETNCEIYCSDIESPFIENPLLEGSFLYGAMPFKGIQNKFLLAQPSKVTRNARLPEGIETTPLLGHCCGMIGVKTSDNVWFIADSLSSEETLEKYHVTFVYDLENMLKTLDKLCELEGDLFIPSHAPATKDIKHIVDVNKAKANEILKFVLENIQQPTYFDNLLAKTFEHYNMEMTPTEFALIGSSVRSYLSYLINDNKAKIDFENNKAYYQAI